MAASQTTPLPTYAAAATSAASACTPATTSINFSPPSGCDAAWRQDFVLYTEVTTMSATNDPSPAIYTITTTNLIRFGSDDVFNSISLSSDQAICIPARTALNECPSNYAYGPCPNGFAEVVSSTTQVAATALCCPHNRFDLTTVK